jgi:antagonist of KipI
VNAFRVIDPGLFSIVQDLGRHGYQRNGLSVSGAADKYSLRFGNLLLGNELNASAIEITLFGLHLEVLEECDIAVTGADLGMKINGGNGELWKVIRVKHGDRIRFRGGPTGCRAYFCVKGGINVPKIFGSRSTDTVVEIGGLNGRPLKKGDEIPLSKPKTPAKQSKDTRWGKLVNPSCIPSYTNGQTIRVILGPQDHMFTQNALEALVSNSYTVTPQSNNMGCHLEGELLEHVKSADILSECIPEGSIQVPSSGKPIILLAGRRGIGGYTKIATVISVDIPKVAQMRPGDRLKFQTVSIEEAQNLLIEEEKYFWSMQLLMNNS